MPPDVIHLAVYVSLFVFLFNSQACAQRRLLNQEDHHASRRVPARIVTVLRPTGAQSTKPSQDNLVKKPPLTAVQEPRGGPPKKEPEGCQKAIAFAILFGVICCLGSVAIFVAVLCLLKVQNKLKHYKQMADTIAAEIDNKSHRPNGTEKLPRKKYHPSVAAARGSTKASSSSPKDDAKKGRKKKKKNLYCKGKNSPAKSNSTDQEIERKTGCKKTPRKERRAQKSPKIKDTPSKDEFAMEISKTQSMSSGSGKAPDSKKPVDKKGSPAGKNGGGTLALQTVPSGKTLGLSEDLTGSTTRRTLSTDSEIEQTLPPPPPGQ